MLVWKCTVMWAISENVSNIFTHFGANLRISCNILVSRPWVNHFSTTGRCSGPAHYDVSIRQAARAAFVTSSFKIILTQTFQRCGATCFIAFEGDDSAIQWCQFSVSLRGSLFNILQLFASFSQNPKLLQWHIVLTTLVICRVMF